jgi:hypothetical protein
MSFSYIRCNAQAVLNTEPGTNDLQKKESKDIKDICKTDSRDVYESDIGQTLSPLGSNSSIQVSFCPPVVSRLFAHVFLLEICFCM